jgi:unspecific monooxygenase
MGRFEVWDPYLFRWRARAFAIMKEFEDLLYDLVRNRSRKFQRKEPVVLQDELVVHMLNQLKARI